MLWSIYPLDVVHPLWPPIRPYFTGYSMSTTTQVLCVLESVSAALNNKTRKVPDTTFVGKMLYLH